ncbi:synaptotagmin-like protein 2 isoform X3 [Anguilla anguilla]|uniref:synaptotagmin-like protein 2 isoform X3 n=1 Tax=Anguilla anguilla TaxID=7936 RepID=UPI0015B12BC8|nr:synaptotagmin-like protein 2 isoform X3 [Anguilla anguilla]
MIDLSHLTEGEQEMIVSVLKRDAELKKADEERIRRLRKAAQDTGKLKYLTGEWFYQTKSQRHRDRIHGSDIIRAAMKQRKPMTILEITQIWAERPSFVNSEIQDIFVPAELSGLIEEPSTQATEKRASGSVSPDVQKDGVILALQSPPKIRRNPFNSVLAGSEASEEPEPQFTNWEAEPITPSDEELLPPSKSPIGSLDKITSEDAGTLEAALPITAPLPQKRTVVHPPLDSLSYNNESFPKWSSVAVERSTVSVAPRGILKRSSSCSSADLPAFCIDRDDGGCSESTDSQKAQQPEKNDRPAQRSESLHSLDRKQVRFSTTVRMSETEEGSTLLADGEFGEHDLLDMQCETFPDEERGECKLGIGSFMGESNNDLTHHGAECKFQKETGDPIPTMTVAESIPGEVTMPATSESQHSRLGSKWEEVDTGETKSSGEGTIMRGLDIGPPQSPSGQHEYSSESCTQGSEDQKGKPVHSMVQGHGLFSRLAEQSRGLAEEQGGPIAKVREGFSWLSDGSNQYDKHSQQRSIREAEEEFGIRKELCEQKVKGPEGSSTGAQTLYGDVSHTEQMTAGSTLMKHPDFFLPYTDTATQRESCITASGNEPGTEGKLTPRGQAQDKTASVSHPFMRKVQLTMKQKDIYEQGLTQRLANLKSFWEKGNTESSILMSRKSTFSKTNETLQEFADKSKVTGEEWNKPDVNVCKVGQELPFWLGETSPAPETMKNIYGHYAQQFKGTKESEHRVLEARIKTNSVDSADGNKITEQSEQSLFQKEAYPNPRKGSSLLEENSPCFESRSMLENQNEEDLYIAKSTIISEHVTVGLKPDIQTGYQGQEIGSKFDSVASSKQTGRQHDDRAGRINNLKSFREKGKSDPKMNVGKQKGSLETEVNQNPEPTPGCAEKELATSGSDLRTVGIDLDNSCDSRSSLLSIKEQIGKELENQTAIKAQYKNIDDWGNVPSVKTELPTTEDVPQRPKSSYSRSQRATHAVQRESPLLVVEPSPDCPPQIPPRCPIKSKTETCSSKSHSVSVCPPIRELMEKDQKQILPIQQKKVHSPEGIPWEPGVTKMSFETKGVFSVGRLPGGQHSCIPQLRRGIKKSLAGEPVVDESLASQKDKESKPEPPRRTSLENLNVIQTHQFACCEYLNEGNQASPEVYGQMNEGRHPSYRKASEGQLSRVPEEAESHRPLARSLIPQSCKHYLGLPEIVNTNDLRVPVTERRKEGSSGHQPAQPEADLDVLPEPVQTRTLRGPQEVSEHPRSMSGSEGHGTYNTPDSSRSNTSKIWSNSWASSDFSPVSTSPSSSFSDQDQMKKRCASMPAFLHGEMDGRDSDTDSENSFHLGGRKSSASTNFSTSSGMASMSSASSSLMSIYSLEFENVEVKGTIQFALSYVQKLGELHVFVVRCRDLAVADTKKNRSDPYVKSYLLPDKAKLGKKKTTVKKKTLNPIYNEILRYKIDVKTLKSHTLNLSVWHHNSFGKNSFLGEVDFKLSEWDLTNTHMNDFTLKGKSPSGLQPTDHRGEIRVALRFLQQGSHGKRTPKTGLVQIFVKDCKNLPFIRGAVIDPFVKCYVLPDTSRKSRQKSRVLRKTANPVFNHTMVYDGFRAEDLEEACVELTVWDHDRLNNHFLGGVRLSLGTGRSHGAVVDWMDSNAAEAMLWKQMMESHNEWVEDVLPLRMLMMAHSMSK